MASQEQDGVVQVVCPSEAELCAEPQHNVSCTVTGCNKTFNTSASRNIHMIQTHRIFKDDQEKERFTRTNHKTLSKVTKQFYCPVRLCNRNIDGGAPFSRLSLLKQHYNVLHAEKKYPCSKCEKRFSTQRQCTNHENICGKVYVCTCGETHKTVESLYMHAKRKEHKLPDEFLAKKRSRALKRATKKLKQGTVFVIPVPDLKSQDMYKCFMKPVPILPHLASSIPLPQATTAIINSLSLNKTPMESESANMSGAGDGTTVNQSRVPAVTTSTQTEESALSKSSKPDMNSTYVQTAQSFFPYFTSMQKGPQMIKRHKKTLAIQTILSESQPGHSTDPVNSMSTQTLQDQGNGTESQTMMHTSIMPQSIHPQNQQSSSNTTYPQYTPSVAFSDASNTQSSQTYVQTELHSHNFSMDSMAVQANSSTMTQHSNLDTNSTQTPWSVVAVSDCQSSCVPRPTLSTGTMMEPPNEVPIQTDLSFLDFLEYSSIETQTFPNLVDAMTDTNEVQHRETGLPSGSRTTSQGQPSGIQNTEGMVSSSSHMETTGLELLFLASTQSTEQTTNSSINTETLDDASCCQQTQTGFNTDTDHQETQTAWEWSLDEFSLLDQYTQTAQSSSGGDTAVPDTDQFSQTSSDLYSDFSFTHMETQTMSIFDLDMFGNSISVQTDQESSSYGLGVESFSDVSIQVQAPPQQPMVSADVQTEAMDLNSLRSRQVGNGHLATSQTQTSFWDDIETLITSDNFTQTNLY